MVDRTTEIFDPMPLYWYKEKWNQKIYHEGIEKSIENISKTSRRARIITPEELVEDEDFFQWCPILKVWKEEHMFPSVNVVGFRLKARSGVGEEWTAIVEALRDGPKDDYRLFACKDFNVGDAVVFFSLYEETTGEDVLGLGGRYARISNNAAETNVHITLNRLLRCSKPIKAGEEIVRWQQQKNEVEFFEKIDRMVFSTEKELPGRIGQEKETPNATVTVHYSDGSQEVISSSNEMGFGYRMERRKGS